MFQFSTSIIKIIIKLRNNFYDLFIFLILAVITLKIMNRIMKKTKNDKCIIDLQSSLVKKPPVEYQYKF